MYSSNTTAIYDTSSFITSCSKSPESNPITHQKGPICFTGDNNTQKIITSNETRLTVAISDLNISEGISFNLSQKTSFKKVIDLARNVSRCYQPPNRNLISKDILDEINYHNMERNPSLIKREFDIFGLLFMVDGTTIYRMPLLKILVSGKNISVAVWELVYFQGHLADGGEKDGTFICNIFLENTRKIDPIMLTGEFISSCWVKYSA